ncbi:MAG: hypothetical protein ACYDH5_11465 [Acidimicrobiales bacterium]
MVKVQVASAPVPETAGAIRGGARPGDGTRPGRGYRRWKWVIGASLVLFVTAAVLADMPRPAARSFRVKQLQSFWASSQGYIAPCAGGLGQALAALSQSWGAPVATGAPVVRAAVRTNMVHCTIAGESGSLYTLATTPVPRSLAGLGLTRAVSDLEHWADPNALAAFGDVSALAANHGNVAAARDLKGRLAALRSGQAAADAAFASAARRLGTSLPPLDLSAQRHLTIKNLTAKSAS